MKCCCALLVCLLGLALVGAAPSLLPGDPNYSPEHAHEHHGEHEHGHHGEHAHGHHGEHAHEGQAHPEGQAHEGQAHPEGQAHEGQAHEGQAHPEGQAHEGQAHPEGQAHGGQAHPEEQAHPKQAHPAQDGFPAFPGQAFPGQAFPGQAFPGQAFPGQAFPEQQFPGQLRSAATQIIPEVRAAPVAGTSLAQGIPDFPSPSYTEGDASAAPFQPAPVGGPSLAQGIPDFPSSYPEADANPAPLPVSGGAAPLPVASRPVQQPGRPSNPFLSGAVVPPASSTFQVQVQPVPARAQRPTPEPIIELNTNPLGGPAGPKGPVQASCPGPASALPCVPEQQCDPYTGFLKSDEVKLPYPITKDTPTVAIGQCKLGGSAIGVCCKKFPRPAPTTTTTALPLGVDYGQGLEHLKRPATEKPPNPFLPNYKPTY